MTTNPDRLTLDTNVIREWWDQQAKHSVVAQLLDLADRGEVELAVTGSIHADIPHDPLAQKIAELSQIGVEERGTVARIGSWQIGVDMLGSVEFAEWHESLGVEEPDWRDFDHLHAHMLLGRDYFLTWDGPIHHLASELSSLWGIEVRRPEEYLKERRETRRGGGPQLPRLWRTWKALSELRR